MASTFVFVVLLTFFVLVPARIPLSSIPSVGRQRLKWSKDLWEKDAQEELSVVAKNLKENVVFKGTTDSLEEKSKIILKLYAEGRFSVYISDREDRNVLLFISVRPGEEGMIFNSLVDSKWDTEERRLIPFELFETVSLDIHINFDHFECIFTDVYPKYYFHRLPYSGNGLVQVAGGAEVKLMEKVHCEDG